jgi:hypothetical protein
MEVIKMNAAHNFSLPDFLNASVNSIVTMLHQTFIVDEMLLFRRCIDWSEKECERDGMAVKPDNQRLVMEPFIYLIAFISMPSTTFSKIPCDSGILTFKEQAAILRIMTGVDVDTAFRRTARHTAKCSCEFADVKDAKICKKCTHVLTVAGMKFHKHL